MGAEHQYLNGFFVCATTEFVARRKHKYATLRELAAAVAAQYAVVAALFDAECLPDDAFACVMSFWLGPRGYAAAPAPRIDAHRAYSAS